MATAFLHSPALSFHLNLSLHRCTTHGVGPQQLGSAVKVKQLRISPRLRFWEDRGYRVGRIFASTSMASSNDTAADVEGAVDGNTSQMEDVVIVGAGIAGMATALALYRVGVKSLVLEQSDTPRTTGTTIGIWSNAWRALEVLGVAEGLRKKFTELTEIELYSADGNCLKSMPLRVEGRDVELRGIERRALLEALREPLPLDTVRFDARVVSIHRSSRGHTQVELEDGSIILTKVLIGADGVRSVVGKWMGFKEPRYVGYTAIRGVGVFPGGHSFNTSIRQILGQGVRAGLVPMDSNRLYWFVVFNSPLGPRISNPELVRDEALSFVQGWPKVIVEAIKNSPPDTLIRSALKDRWLWPFVGPKLFNGGVTLAGDALHPMTPNLGQGGCCALEDAVILGRELSKALAISSIGRNVAEVNGHLKVKDTLQEMKKIELALETYTNERWHRMFPLAIRSYAVGALLQVDLQLVCSARDKILPKILKIENFIDHTFYDCGSLSVS